MKPYNAESTQQVLTPPVVDEGRYKLHTPAAAVGIPFGQALISGAISGVAVMILAWVFDILDPWKPGLVIFALVTPMIWFLSRRNWVGLVNRVEEWTGLDLDQDGDVNDEQQVTRIEWKESTGTNTSQTKRLQIPISPEKMSRLAVDILLRHKNFTFGEFAGKGKLCSDGKFKELQKFFYDNNFAVKDNPEDDKSGYTLTPRGIKLLQSHLPYPVGKDGVLE